MRNPTVKTVFLLWAAMAAFGDSVSTRNYFYTHPRYGSQSMFNPASVLINGGYDIVQTGMYGGKLVGPPYLSSAQNVLANLVHPLRQIERHGWGTFLSTEVFPTSLRIDRSQYLPNYTLHVLGGGTTYRMLCEWNAAHGIPYPRISAVAFATAYNFLNEVMENGPYRGVNVDPIADMWLFNPLGILLFSSDDIARFFSSSVCIFDWSSMPCIDPVSGLIDNASQNWAVTIPLPLVDRTRLFVFLGMSEVAGLSYNAIGDYTVSGGGGFSVGDIVEADSNTNAGRIMTIHYSWTAGIFIDKGNSLLFSLLLSNSRMYKARANLYPLPRLRFGFFHPGFFMGLANKNDFAFGITATCLPVSLAARVR